MTHRFLLNLALASSFVGLLAPHARAQVTAQEPSQSQAQILDTPKVSGTAHFEAVKAVAFAPNGVLASASDDGAIKLWNIARDVAVSPGMRRVLVAGAPISCLAWAPNGKTLASAGRDGIIRLWDVEEKSARWGRVLGSLRGHSKAVNGLAFSPDGKTLASGSDDRSLILWDVATRQKLRTWRESDTIAALSWSPDGRRLADAVGTAIEIHEVAGQNALKLSGSSGTINALAWSPDGNHIAGGGWDKILRVWNASNGTITRTLNGHQGWISAVAWNAADLTLWSAAWDKTIRNWGRIETAPEQVSGPSATPNDTVLCLTFAPDGKTLVGGGLDQTLRLWDATTGAARATLIENSPSRNSPGENFPTNRRARAHSLFWNAKSEPSGVTARRMLLEAVHLDVSNDDYIVALAQSHQSAGEFSSSVRLLKARLQQRRGGPSYLALRAALSDAHLEWALQLSAQNRASDAMPHLLLALDLDRVARPARAATALYELGAASGKLGKIASATGFYERSRALFHQSQDAAGEAGALNGLGLTLRARGRLDEAASALQRALVLSREAMDTATESAALNGLALVQIALGRYEVATENLQNALRLKREAGDAGGEGVVLNNLGLAAQGRNRYGEAGDFFTRALAVHEKGRNWQEVAATTNNLGANYHYLGEYRQAEQWFRRALSWHRQQKNRVEEANDLSNLGYSYFPREQPAQAARILETALQLRRQVKDRAGEGVTLSNLGAAYGALGRTTQALQMIAQARQIAREVGDREGEGVSLYQQALIETKLRRFPASIEHLRQSLAIFRETGALAREANALRGLMLAHRAQQQVSLAIFYGKSAVNAYQEVRRGLQNLGQDLQKSFLASKEDTYRVLADLLVSVGRLPEAQQAINLLKGEEYLQFVRGNSSDPQAPVSLNSAEQEYEAKYRQLGDSVTSIAQKRGALLAKKKLGALSAGEDAALSGLNTQFTGAGQAFKAFLDQLAGQFAQDPIHRVADVKEARALKGTLEQLGAGTVALYTIAGKERYTVILFTPDAERPASYSISAADLSREVQSFREILQNPELDPVPQAKKLYKILIGPIEAELRAANAQTLMWSLDGGLRYLPVAALHDEKGYLVERFRNVVFTPASLPNLIKQPQTTWKGLGMGVSQPHPGFNALPDVPEELSGIIEASTATQAIATSTAILNGKVMLDKPFTQPAMLESLQEGIFPVVHIASHFAFEPGNDANSYLLLGDGAHLSLATIEEQTNLFRGVELLTLSACNTATGGTDANGKEVEGFGVLAQQQGAQSVVASLWPVADESTALLMKNFYRLREAQPALGKAEALRQAQLALLQGASSAAPTRQRRSRGGVIAGAGGAAPIAPAFTPNSKTPLGHPYFWAPFILIGNWR